MLEGLVVLNQRSNIIDSNTVAKAGFLKGRTLSAVEQYLNEMGADGWEVIDLV